MTSQETALAPAPPRASAVPRLARFARPAAGLAVGALLAIATTSPIWIAQLIAPQYPKGLWLRAYGDGFQGDLSEINNLNHYIGMRSIDPAMIPELQLYGLALALVAVLALLALAVRGVIGRLAMLSLWAAPLVALGDIQRWLIQYGRDLDPEAALRLKPFVPLVIGPTNVWNFRIVAFPGPALGALALIALVVTLARRAPRSGAPRRGMPATGVALLAVAMIACTPQSAHEQHTTDLATATRADHGPHATWLSQIAPPAAAQFDVAAAVASAAPGAEVRVPAGTYLGPIVIDRPLTLVADGHVIIDGQGRGTVLTLAAPGITVRGLHLRGSGGQVEDAAAVAVLADHARVEHVLVTDSYTGILVRAATGVGLVGNRIVGPGELAGDGTLDATHTHASTGEIGDGISIWDARGVLVRDNEIEGVRDGIYLSYDSDVLIDSNQVSDSRYAVHAMFGQDLMIFGNRLSRNASGLVLMYTRGVEASRNRIQDQRSPATGYGVLLKDVIGARLVENVIRGNSIGLKAEGVEPGEGGAKALRNDISYNVVGAQLFPTAAIALSQNSFVDNLVQVELPGGRSKVEWTDRGTGNHWSDHRGYDLNADGRSDLPHVESAAGTDSLRAFRGTLAGRIFERAQRAWALISAPPVTDRAPLLEPVIRAAADSPRDGTDAPLWLVAGILSLGAAGGTLAAARRTR